MGSSTFALPTYFSLFPFLFPYLPPHPSLSPLAVQQKAKEKFPFSLAAQAAFVCVCVCVHSNVA